MTPDGMLFPEVSPLHDHISQGVLLLHHYSTLVEATGRAASCYHCLPEKAWSQLAYVLLAHLWHTTVRSHSSLLTELVWYESVENMKSVFAIIWSRICGHIPPKVEGRLFRVWKSAFPSWMKRVRSFGYGTSDFPKQMQQGCFVGLVIEAVGRSQAVGHCRREGEGH